MIGEKNYVAIRTTTKMMKLSFDDSDIFLTNQRAYTSYHISYRCVVWPDRCANKDQLPHQFLNYDG
jgi:hypothetical protein